MPTLFQSTIEHDKPATRFAELVLLVTGVFPMVLVAGLGIFAPDAPLGGHGDERVAIVCQVSRR